MTTEHVKATVAVKSENFNQDIEESFSPSFSTSASYEHLIAANERLRASLSKILTEFVEKARTTAQQSTDIQKKRKLKTDDDNDDAGSASDNPDEEEDNNEEEEEDDEEEEIEDEP